MPVTHHQIIISKFQHQVKKASRGAEQEEPRGRGGNDKDDGGRGGVFLGGDGALGRERGQLDRYKWQLSGRCGAEGLSPGKRATQG